MHTADPADPGQKTRIEVIPANETRGHCPTLRVDGALWHDPVQPYRPVFPLEGTRPDVVALFGLGLGYTAAGSLQISPQARVVAWEPIPELAEMAAALLRDEWQVDGRVTVETDPADFQARLLSACQGARSLASIELPALREANPDRARLFRRMVQEVVDADTLTSLSPASDEADPAAGIAEIARHPRLLQVIGPWKGQTALLVASVPDEATRAAIRARHGSLQVVTSSTLAPSLARAGLQPDLVVVRDPMPPGDDVAAVTSESLLAITPDSHPAWWRTPAAGRFTLGHTNTAWMLPDGDPGRVLSFRFGAEVPMAATSLALGAVTLVPVGFERSADAHWNWLSPSRRRERLIRRLASQTGALWLEWSGPGEELPDPHERPDIRTTLGKAAPLGSEPISGALERAAAAIERITREAEQLATTLDPDTLRAYVAQRAEADPFTRVFVSARLNPACGGDAHADLAAVCHRAHDVLVRARAHLGEPETAAAATRPPRPSHLPRLKVFLGGSAAEDLPRAVLASQVRRFAATPVDVVVLRDAITETFGPRARNLPVAAQKMLIPALCGYEGRAVYLEPSVLVFGDVTELAFAETDGAAALAPVEGPASVLLVDAERAGWNAETVLAAAEAAPDQLEGLLAPSVSHGIAALDPAWCRPDDTALHAQAVRITCPQWLPWISDHHPATWAWEAMLAAARREGTIPDELLVTALKAGQLRRDLAETLARVAAPPASAPGRTPVGAGITTS